jgi:hypothetical protein
MAHARGTTGTHIERQSAAPAPPISISPAETPRHPRAPTPEIGARSNTQVANSNTHTHTSRSHLLICCAPANVEDGLTQTDSTPEELCTKVGSETRASSILPRMPIGTPAHPTGVRVTRECEAARQRRAAAAAWPVSVGIRSVGHSAIRPAGRPHRAAGPAAAPPSAPPSAAAPPPSAARGTVRCPALAWRSAAPPR